MAKNKTYTAADIEVLSDRDHVRLRLPVYAGDTHPAEYLVPYFRSSTLDIELTKFTPAIFGVIGEIFSNSIDEFAQITKKNKVIDITADNENGHYTIADNGRGVPLEKHKTGKHTPEVVFGSLRSGRNFVAEKEAGVIGMNGMGSSILNFVSSVFEVSINRDGKKYTQTFTNGALQVSKPRIVKGPKAKTGTQISFTLDPTVFTDITLPEELMLARAKEIAFTNPGLQVNYNGEKFLCKNGLEDLIKDISQDYFKFETDSMEFFVIFDVNKDIDEQIFTYVNSSLLFNGGLCNTQFLNAFYDRTITHLKPAAKKQKCDVTKNDVRQNLLVLGVMKIANPEYDAQSKTRLTGPNLRKEMSDFITAQWNSFARKNKQWLEKVLERATDRHHSSANKQAVKDMARQSRKKVAGLTDANSRNRFECNLLVTEGKSASAMVTDVRDPKTTATFPLTGKINNVYGMTVAQILKAGKITDLLMAIGLIPGQKALRSALRYGKIIIAVDADPDGNDIFTLLVNLFYQFWPELFDPAYEPIVYKLIAPNVVAVKGKKRIHFSSRLDYENVKNRYKGYEISYLKGLGSMIREDYAKILKDEECLIPIVDDGMLKDTLELLFGKDASVRKAWLQ